LDRKHYLIMTEVSFKIVLLVFIFILRNAWIVFTIERNLVGYCFKSQKDLLGSHKPPYTTLLLITFLTNMEDKCSM
jgi:uncharacterized membrane protein SpoIIM required for sporulation